MRRLTVVSFLLLLLVLAARAQEVPSGIEEILEQLQDAESGASAEELLQWYESLLLAPLNLNAATRSQLEELRLLTLFQIESLLEYREEYGDLLSFSELAAVDGFNRDLVETLRPFITLEDAADGRLHAFSQVRTRVKWKNSQEGLYRYARYLGGAGRFSYGATFESDAQESWLPDFISAHVQYDAGRFKLLAGDFTASYGQGLAMDKSFAMSALGSPSGILKRKNDFRGYTATGENDALRGLAAAVDFGAAGRLQLFFSAASLDASVTDSTYSSLPTSGYHRTDYQKKQKNALREFTGCINYSIETGRLLLSLTAVGYGYDRHNARRVQDYNRYQMYDGLYGNLALSALYSMGHCRLFGEAALDLKGTPAALAGLVWSPGYNFESSLLLRAYPKEYIASHGGAYSSLSTVSNQYGAVVNLLARPFNDFTLTAMGEVSYHPHSRYRIDGPSFVAGFKARAEYGKDSWSVFLQDNYTFKDYEDSHKHALKLQAAFKPAQRLSLSCRADCVLLLTGAEAAGVHGYRLERGLGASLRADCRIADRFALWGSVTCFDSQSYQTRIYAYEKDLPQSFSVMSYSGRGLSASLLATLDLFAGFRLSLKASTTGFANEGTGRVFELRGQADWKF